MSEQNKLSQKEKEVMEHIKGIREIDPDIFDAMTTDGGEDDSVSAERTCARWVIDPVTGRKICLEWK